MKRGVVKRGAVYRHRERDAEGVEKRGSKGSEVETLKASRGGVRGIGRDVPSN